MFLASRNLFYHKGRLLLSVIGVALALTLVILLDGLLKGTSKQVTAYLDHTPGSLVLLQEGANSLAAASSLLPKGSSSLAREVAGVARVIPVLSQTAYLDLGGKKIFTFLMGYDPNQGGGPWNLAAGRHPLNAREIVMDQTLAQIHKIKLNDTLEFGGYSFTVVGLSGGTKGWMTTIVFLRKADLAAFMRMSDIDSFLLLEPAAGVKAQDLQKRLAELPGVDVLLKSEVNKNDLRFSDAVFKPMQFMSIIAFWVASLLVGMLIYTSILEQKHEYGVLKAIGSSNSFLYGLVLKQSLILTLMGALLGMAVAAIVAGVIMVWQKQFLVVLEPQTIGLTLFSALVMALIAVLVPMKMLMRLSPAEVFRS